MASESVKSDIATLPGILELVKLNSATLPGIADAIRAKTGGTALLLPYQMAAAIKGIQTGVVLPELTTPAEESDVLSGQEYIDATGAKKAGTLVVCDTIQDVEHFGLSGTGVQVALESTADGSTKDMMLPESNLAAENIKSGVSIFGVAGTAKILRVETGTITPAEDTATLSIPCSANPQYAVLITTSDTAAEGDVLGAICANIDYTGKFAGNCFASYYYSAKIRSAAFAVTFDSGISIPEIGSVCFYRAGVAYQWTAYYWEDA